jgi:hypothetical protein
VDLGYRILDWKKIDYELRDAGSGFRDAGYGLRVADYIITYLHDHPGYNRLQGNVIVNPKPFD